MAVGDHARTREKNYEDAGNTVRTAKITLVQLLSRPARKSAADRIDLQTSSKRAKLGTRMQLFEYRSVRSWSKEINRTLTGGRKINFFNSRSRALRSMAAAPVESCRSTAQRSPWGRLGSVLYTCNRLRRLRGRFDRWIHISTCPQPRTDFSQQSATGPRAARARSPASRRATGRAAHKKRGAYWCAGAAAP